MVFGEGYSVRLGRRIVRRGSGTVGKGSGIRFGG